MKTRSSRFQIHDDLTAPKGSVPVLKGAMKNSGGQLPNFIGVLAGSPAALRAYTLYRSELRKGLLTPQTHERISLAVAEQYNSESDIDRHIRAARRSGLGVDEIALAREFDSRDFKHAALLRYLKVVLEERGGVPVYLHEEAREAGWNDEELLEALAFASLEGFSALINVAGDVPTDGSHESSRELAEAA